MSRHLFSAYLAPSYLKWTTRIMAIPVNSPYHFLVGFCEMNMPTVGTLIDFYPSGNLAVETRAVINDGILLNSFEALLYRVSPGHNYFTVNSQYAITYYDTNVYNPDENWIIIALDRSGDDGSLNYLHGHTNIKAGGTYPLSF